MSLNACCEAVRRIETSAGLLEGYACPLHGTQWSENFIDEVPVIINGQPLSRGEVMALRAAVGNFLLDLRDREFYAALGTIGPFYKEKCIAIEQALNG